ncbi:MAG: hypothetical protein A2V98_01550 [Planctomycetes bacterium RBG_16_64_12]|nr:MAG: hypothetical protein A2V98_01550 [Planctomycetes bacterium RBG_16_64_12]
MIPNFLYIGTSKAGSTWIYNLLNHHPDIYLAPGKGLYFFDGHFQRGWSWYLSHFQAAGDRKVIGEISHSYLFSPEACARIFDSNPEMRLMACVREPVERSFSAYLDGVKNGQIHTGFEEALRDVPSLVDRGRYATHLRRYVERFGRQNIHVAVFDELGSDPRSFAARLFAFLEVEPIELSPRLTGKIMPAARPRSRRLVKLAKGMSRVAKRLGQRRLRGRIKRSRLIRNLLYRQFTHEDRPTMEPQTRRMLQERFREEVYGLDALIGTDCATLWDYR